MEETSYTLIVEPLEEGGFWAYVPALPGCFTKGETLEEISLMGNEAIEGFLEELAEHGQPIPVEPESSPCHALEIRVRTPDFV